MTARRGQAAVVGVALLLAITVLSIAGLTATIGTVVEESADATETGRVAHGFDAALDPHAGAPHQRRLAVSSGAFRTTARTVRLVDGPQTLATWRADALVYGEGTARVAYLAGAVVTGRPGNALLRTHPAIAVADGNLYVGLPTLGTDGVTGVAPGAGGAVLRTNVTHARRTFTTHSSYGLAVETVTPGVWERFFEERGATTSRQEFDGDGVGSVVARFPATEEAHLTVHDLRLVIRSA